MKFIEKYAKIIIAISPTIFAFLYGLKPIINQQSSALIDLCLTTIHGIVLTLVFSSLHYVTKDFNRVLVKGYKDALDEQLGDIPSLSYLENIYGRLPQSFKCYLNKEKRYVRKGFKQIKHDKTWPISTARSYEAIISQMAEADKINIIDQAIERWFELTPNSDSTAHGYSTTFNYSQRILTLLSKRIESFPHDYRRIIVITNKQWQILQDELSNTSLNFDELTNTTRIVLQLFDFERKLSEEIIEKTKFGTNIINGDALSLANHETIDKLKDIVLFNNEIAFIEHVSYKNPTPSDETRSNINYNEDFINDALANFERLWLSPSLSMRNLKTFDAWCPKIINPIVI